MIIVNDSDYSNPYDESNDNKTKIKEWIIEIIKVLLACVVIKALIRRNEEMKKSMKKCRNVIKCLLILNQWVFKIVQWFTSKGRKTKTTILATRHLYYPPTILRWYSGNYYRGLVFTSPWWWNSNPVVWQPSSVSESSALTFWTELV